MKHTSTAHRMLLKLIIVLAFASSCTKSRPPEFATETERSDILAISELSGSYKANRESLEPASASVSLKASDESQTARISSDEVEVPAKLKFMFDNLPVSTQTAQKFDIRFLVDKEYVTAFKVVSSIRELTALEGSLAMGEHEVELIQKGLRASGAEQKGLAQSLEKSERDRKLIQAGKKDGKLLVPMFKYKILEYGTVVRGKNDMKEETAVLEIARTEFKNATHIKVTATNDKRLTIGGKLKEEIENLYVESKLDNVLTTSADLQAQLKIEMKFVADNTPIFTRIGVAALHVYEVTKLSSLNENQLRLLKHNAGNQEVIRCDDQAVAKHVRSEDADCVLLLVANIPMSHTVVELKKESDEGIAGETFKQTEVPRASSVGLVTIAKGAFAQQKAITGTLDPNTAIRISDIKGEFLYRRTFEAASNMFLGRTGTSGDMSIVKFELEDNRLVVRNEQSLIAYTGQGPKDREEIMSFPVKYIRMKNSGTSGSTLTIPVAEETTKEKAEYAIIDWTQNTVPNASSPLAFYADGACFMANSSQQVTDMDMRLQTQGILNFSLSGSYTMQPRMECIAIRDVNSAYWAGTFQFNYNVTERISFKRRANKDSDVQFGMNISSMAQEAFNFGTFGLADKVTDNGTLTNKDGSEKYMPIIHDLRNGKKVKWYLGGLNTGATNTEERRQLLIEATKEVVADWNKTLRYAFRGVKELQRDGDYLELVVDDGSTEPIGHLGDLDRNYIWFQELPAENGLLGVAQPAANPRSGIVESANVIVYTGNTLDQSLRLLKMTQKARAYEKALEAIRLQTLEEAKKTGETVASKDQVSEAAAAAAAAAGGASGQATVAKVKSKVSKMTLGLKQAFASLGLNSSSLNAAVSGKNMQRVSNELKKKATKELYKKVVKGEALNFEVNKATFLKKITELAMNKSLVRDRHQFELAVNNAFLKFGGLDEDSKAVLQKHSERLAIAARFDANNKNRPGCFMYTRNDANDESLIFDEDPKKNLMANFKKNVMTTLSHELGHAFGLLHNFTASTDRKNYEFATEDGKVEQTGRNYSSIMDYIADIDQTYRGLGPYDAHAIRAAYTGLVELSAGALEQVKNLEIEIDGKATKVPVVNDKLVHINHLLKAMGIDSLVHLTKETLNKTGVLKHYAQCSDGGIGQDAMCAQFDVGGSASEIVQNKIADYHRGYMNRFYVYDSIIFNWNQKVDAITRNIRLFQGMREYLDAAIMSAIFGTGLPEQENQALVRDQVEAAKMGYRFFHELLRTPDASGVSANNLQERVIAIPYEFAARNEDQTKGRECRDENGQKICKEVRVLEARSVYDKMMDKDKIDTIGIGYDKVFAMQFLTQASQSRMTNESQMSLISYLDFEQFFLNVTDPSESLTISTLKDIMVDQLTVGFFDINGSLLQSKMPVEINRMLSDDSAIAAILNLSESKWKGYDAFADTFKTASSLAKSAPKDRFNIARAGQDRQKSDTRVMFATQNAFGSDSIVRLATRSEVLLDNKASLSKLMLDLHKADSETQKLVSVIAQAACGANAEGKLKDEAGCKAVLEKPIEQHVKENAHIAKSNAVGDKVAKQLLAKVRQLNAKEAIMSNELDKEESPVNFARQVEVVRYLLAQQLNTIIEFVVMLESAKDEAELQTIIGQIVPELQKLKAQNKKFDHLPLLSFTQLVMTEAVADVKDANADGIEDKFPASLIAENMMDGAKLKTGHASLAEMLGKLSVFTSYIDPETSMK